MLVPGDVIGNYRIERFLGQGSMGILYVAEHLLIGRRVALKTLAPEIAARPDAVSLFFREARAANKMNHPNIVQITDLVEGTDVSPTFLVMEYLEGYSLREVLDQEGCLEARRVAEIGAIVADAMDAAHRGGVIHRDLKPDNILLCVDAASTVKVLDFGIAHLGSSTGSDLPCGTPLYISPELAGADSADQRSDIYSLGALLYEALAGTPVFDYESVRELFIAHIAEAPKPLGLAGKSEAALEALVMQCLAKSASDRPQSMAEVSDRLGRIVEGWAAPRAATNDDEQPPLDADFLRKLDNLWFDEGEEEGEANELADIGGSDPRRDAIVGEINVGPLSNVLAELDDELRKLRAPRPSEGSVIVSDALAAAGAA